MRIAYEERRFNDALKIINVLEKVDHPRIVDLLQGIGDQRSQIEIVQAEMKVSIEERKSSIRSLLLDGEVKTASKELRKLSKAFVDNEVLELRDRAVDLASKIEEAETRRSAAQADSESAAFLAAAKEVVHLRPKDPNAAEWLAKAKALRRTRFLQHLAAYFGIPVVMLFLVCAGIGWFDGFFRDEPAPSVEARLSHQPPLTDEEVKLCLEAVPGDPLKSSPAPLIGKWELVDAGLSEVKSLVMTVDASFYRIEQASAGPFDESSEVIPPIGWVGRMSGRLPHQVEMKFCLDRQPGENGGARGRWRVGSDQFGSDQDVLLLTIVTCSGGRLMFSGTDKYFDGGFPRRVMDENYAAEIPRAYVEGIISRSKRYKGLVLPPDSEGNIPEFIWTTKWRRLAGHSSNQR